VRNVTHPVLPSAAALLTTILSIPRGAKEQYGVPMESELSDAKKKLFVWVLGSEPDDDRVIPLPRGPRVHIIGQAPGDQP
jgi:hypothetical protein